MTGEMSYSNPSSSLGVTFSTTAQTSASSSLILEAHQEMESASWHSLTPITPLTPQPPTEVAASWDALPYSSIQSILQAPLGHHDDGPWDFRLRVTSLSFYPRRLSNWVVRTCGDCGELWEDQEGHRKCSCLNASQGWSYRFAIKVQDAAVEEHREYGRDEPWTCSRTEREGGESSCLLFFTGVSASQFIGSPTAEEVATMDEANVEALARRLAPIIRLGERKVREKKETLPLFPFSSSSSPSPRDKLPSSWEVIVRGSIKDGKKRYHAFDTFLR